MSVKNKATDRDDAGKIKRSLTGPETDYWLGQTPKWWVKLFMTRPRRRKNRWACQAVLKGAVPDFIAWPTGNRRPHVYYW